MSEIELYESKDNSESFLQYGNEKPPPIVVVVGDGRSRVRRVVRTATRHVTVVSYSTRHKETRTHTSHHVTTVSFPQKSIERSGSTQYDIAAPSGSTASGSTLSTDCGGYVYLQQHYIPSSSSSAAINYPVMQQSHMIYQQHHPQQQQQQYANSCHQQQIAHQSAAAAATGTGGMHHGQHVSLHHQHHHHHLLHGHHHHHGGAVVIAGSGVGTGGAVGVAGSGGPGSTSPSAIQQNMHKKNSIRNGSDVLKRARAQTAYELSQDLLEKQIELLERKYGGVRARNAAVTIQRAFRHYMMVKKFASITAMAKAEKRLSRRVLIVSGGAGGTGAVVGGIEDAPASNSSLSSAYGSATESQLDLMQQQQLQSPGTTSPYAYQQSQTQQQQQQQARVTILAGPPGSVVGTTSVPIVSSNAISARTPPTRSLSMRERRQQDGSPIPRSQSGASSVPIGGGGGSSASSTSSGGTLGSTTHPHVNLLHATEPHFYGSQHLATHYYQVPPHEASYASSANNSHLDSSLNTSWASVASGTSPHTPYYSAAQIYMRPKGAPGSTSAERKKVPPEVPKRTSSIAAQQHAQHLAAQQQHQHMLMMRQTPPPPSLLRSNGLCKSAENGSLTSVQSSGSDSSVTSADRIAVNSDIGSDRSNSPQTWKRNTALSSSQQFVHNNDVGTVAFSLAQAGMVTDGRGGGSVVGAANTSDDHAISSHNCSAV
uniref:IQ motif and SEC7 domain-containing protein 2 n=1 Tax=Bactrocera dorsalis TaxID=27457 RepID=A0A034V9I8_BACDO